MVEIEDREAPGGEAIEAPRENPRVGERRSMYLTRKDFRTRGHTPGCQGCLDIASGRPGPTSGLSPHTKACRSRMNEAIKAADPARWEKYLRRRGEDPVDVEGPPSDAGAPDSSPAIEEARDEDDDDGWGGLFDDLPEAEGVGTSAGPSPEAEGRASSSSGAAPATVGHTELVEKLLSVDVCEVFSPPRGGKLARKYGLIPGDAMDLFTGWDFNIESRRKRAEIYLD